MASRLYRPRNDRWIAGVCAGLARRFGISPGMMRLIFVVSCLLLVLCQMAFRRLERKFAERL